MTRLVLPVLVVLVGLVTLNDAWGEAANSSGPALVPWPKTLRAGQGAMPLTERSRIVAADKALTPLAAILSEEIFTVAGVRLATGDGKPANGDIALALDPSLKGESYTLAFADTAVVSGADYFAVAAGTATLLQAMTGAGGELSLPRLTVEDEPAYPYRGVLIDLGRKYHSPGGIKQVIELCRLYKIRYLHVHISDDQLFMFPSTRFPQAGKGNGEFARFEPKSKPHVDPYTLEELRDLERFSQARGVHIVPEMDLPGHSGRLVGDVPETFAFPGNGSTVNIAGPRTLEAVAALLGEVMDVFQ
ncbi:MAG: family 20 glycosylhydrolase, partial [Planctomycetota bacterium]|nr:family 20 glycosylhydrolase [Planctomycetota bacterium]